MSFWHAYMGIEGGGTATVTTSIYYNILSGVLSAIQGLDLTDMPAANIKLIKVENFRETVEPGLPGVLVFPISSENIAIDEGTTCSDDVGYPVGVLILDADRQDTSTGLPEDADDGTQDQAFRYDQKLLWRQQIRNEFINQRLSLPSSMPSVYRCTIEPGEVVRSNDFLEANIWVSAMVIRCWTRERRA